ncbi:MAG: type II secretion system F family protein [Magnetococcales bacterium]|nr:type II secretion system F family protein [Magnetococcales bacterium]MBF0150603.1 type II secretion system F family protein [Magnetococcales bacterium]MBF0174276.1 type II secretion system F family protein [Magnetococcales bacterium]MBF0629379.1 type II secretion system F family protein [Magnetococcales bacterium]
MDMYQWEAKTKTGEKKSGEMESEDSGEVAAVLRKRGLTAIKVKKVVQKKPLFGEPKITDMEVVVFTRQLATMVGAGLPLVTCFDLSSRGAENPQVREITSRVKKDIEAGTSLTEALLKEPKMFDELFVNLVSAGEQSGILEAVLERLSIYKEKAAALRAKVKSAMTYPIAVISIAFIITGVLMIFVVPTFGELFKDFGAELPAPTRVVIALSEWTQTNWWIVVFGIGGSIRAFSYFYKNNKRFHYLADKMSLNLPVFGMILRKSAIARFARTFGTMIAAGTPILESLDNVAKTAGNMVVEEVISLSKNSISQGLSLTEPLSESDIFPPMVIQMINIGESTGNLEIMLSKIADFYEAEVDRAVDNLTALLEPMILVILGVLIGGLVVAMYMPIFQMGAVVG